MAQITLNSSGVASNGSLVLQSNGTTTAATFDTSQKLTLPNDAVVNGLTVGRGAGAVSTNTAVGASALAASSTGIHATGIGYQALTALTSGNDVTAVGYQALKANTTGYSNSAYGSYSLYLNTTGLQNSALGDSSLSANTTGGYNTAVGGSALASNTTASNNTAVGYQALYSNTVSTANSAFGYQAGYYSQAGAGLIGNCYFGRSAGYGDATGYYNTYLGDNSGPNGVTNASAAYNTGVGRSALAAITTGGNNTAVGAGAGSLITTGTKNTVLGAYNGNQGLDIRTASNYVVLSDGDGNTQAWVQGTVYSNSWYQRSNSSSWATTSDQRIKKNIENVKDGLQTILALRPVEFDYIITGAHDTGFIAQEYEQVLPHQITHEENASQEVKELTNGEPVKGIQQNLVPYLVAAIKELKAEFDAYKEAHP